MPRGHNVFPQSPGPQENTFPKDPAVLKILRRSKFTMRSKFIIAQWFTMATPPVLTQFSLVLSAFFPWKRGSHRSKKGGGAVKTLRRSNSLSRSVFSTAESLGLWDVHDFRRGRPWPEDYFRALFLAFRAKLFPFCDVIFGDPPKRPFKTSIKLTSLGLV